MKNKLIIALLPIWEKYIAPVLLSSKAATTARLLWNKGVAIALLILALFKYSGLSDAPFAELMYAVILVGTTIVTAPIIRFLVFPVAADMAEKGEVKRLIAINTISPALIHYWICTVISYSVTLVCVSSLL
jgi:hypothetical protein